MPIFSGTGLVGVGLEPGIRGRSSVKPGDSDGRDAASGYFVKDPGSPANVFSRAVAAYETAVFYFTNTGDLGKIVAHGITDGNSLDLIDRADAGEIRDDKVFCSLARDPELTLSPANRMAVVP